MPQSPRPWFRKQTGWWMVQIDRRQVKLVEGQGNKREAERKLREILTLKDSNPSPESGRLTVAAVIDLFLEHAKVHLSPDVLAERKHYLQLFAEKHGFRVVNDKDCLPYHLTSWIDAHAEWSDWTKHHAVNVVHRPFNWAAKQRLIAANPFRGVSHRAGEPRRPMSDDEFERLLVASERPKKAPKDRFPNGRKVCPSDLKRRNGTTPADRFREILRFLRLSGARPGEASKLRWEEIDLGQYVIVIVKHKTSRTQRQPKPRVIPLTQELVDLLVQIRKRNEPDEFVFHTHRGSRWNRCSLSLRMQRAREKAGIPDEVKLYGLRHAFGTRAIMNGVDIKTLAELMGHTTSRMTEHYLHLAGQHSHLQEAMRRVNQTEKQQPPPPATHQGDAPSQGS